jgi:hypothetical protein
MLSMEPFELRTTETGVELWSGYRIQFDGFERHEWQKKLKVRLREHFSNLTVPAGVPFVGYYDTTDPGVSDTENSLFTNLRECMPRSISRARFEHGTTNPPTPPVPISLVGGHVHYYRYTVGAEWTRWEPDQMLAHWYRIDRRLAADGSARPAWYALRQAGLEGQVFVAKQGLDPGATCGLRLTVHATKRGPRNAISYCEELVDGTIAAFHTDQTSETLLAILANKFPGVSLDGLRRALDHLLGPLFSTPAMLTAGGRLQISPADERCRLGEVIIREDSKSAWPQLSGELFTLRPIRPVDR